MTREQAIKELKEKQNDSDIECAHSYADDVLCKLLIALGYADVVEEYKKINKWYT